MFCMFKTSVDADKILDFLNNGLKKYYFTIEKEKEQKLPSLVLLIAKINNKRITTNYKKSTNTGRITNYLSFIPTRKVRLG